jgi:hypothetical protein
MLPFPITNLFLFLVNTALSRPETFNFKYDDEILRLCSNLDITTKLEKLDGSLSAIVDKLSRAAQEIVSFFYNFYLHFIPEFSEHGLQSTANGSH